MIEPIAATERLAAREVLETIQNSYYQLEHAAIARLGELEGRNFINWCLQISLGSSMAWYDGF
jgi:hypothetical protein